MLLDIIVPHHKERWEVVRPFFDVIQSQKGVDFQDFRVLLVHDGVDPFPDEYFQGPAQIEQICLPAGGVSAARNYGIDHTEAEWINFSDCDDCYCSVFALYMIFHVLKTDEKYNLLWSPFYSIYGDKLLEYSEYSPVFIHNKYYRTSFLKEKDIRFCEKLYMSEDSAFNTIVTAEVGDGKVGSIRVKEPLYSWCRRGDSVTLDPSRKLKNCEGHFDRNLYVLEEYVKRIDPDSSPMVGRVLTDAYAQLMMLGDGFDTTAFLQRVADFYREHRSIFLTLPQGKLDKLMAVSDLEAGTTEECRKNRPTLFAWLESLIE